MNIHTMHRNGALLNLSLNRSVAIQCRLPGVEHSLEDIRLNDLGKL